MQYDEHQSRWAIFCDEKVDTIDQSFAMNRNSKLLKFVNGFIVCLIISEKLQNATSAIHT